MKKKSIIAILLTLVLCISLSACGGDEKPIELTEEELDGVKYSIPEEWDKKIVDTSGALTLQHIYYPDLKDTSNSIDIKILEADNKIYSINQAEHYVGVFMESFYSKSQGYETVECETNHHADVPSKYGIYTMDSSVGKLTITSYCFLMDSDKIFLISYWHVDSSDEDYSQVFEDCVKSVEILSPAFYYTDNEISTSSEKKAPAIGMTKEEVRNSYWGSPDSTNVDEYEWGTKEQWVYEDRGYIYFENGIVDAIQHR